MNGTLAETRPGVWRLRVYLGRDGNGRVINASRTVRGTKGDAQRQLRRFVDEVARTRVPERGVTVERLLERWLGHVESERSPSTMKEHRRSVTANIVPALGGVVLDRLTPEQLDRAYAAWAKRGLSPASIRRQHAILSAALHQAVKWGWLDRNPAERATPPTVRARAGTATISAVELRQLVAAAETDDPLLAAAIALAALTGCRRGELCALRWSDIHLDPAGGGVLTVARAITVQHGQIHEGPTKTHQVRRLALDPVAIAVVARRQDQQRALALRAGTELDADPYLLSRRADGALPALPDGLTHAFARLCVDQQLVGAPTAAGQARPLWRFHDLRHFAATTAIAAGIDVRTVAGRLGHADASTTLRVYAHAVAVADQHIAAALGAALTPTPEPAGTGGNQS